MTPTASADADRRQSPPLPSTSGGSPNVAAILNAGAGMVQHASAANYSISSSSSPSCSSNQRTDLDVNFLKNKVLDLLDENQSEDVLEFLSKVVNNSSRCQELAPMLWNTPRVMFVLLEETMKAYRFLTNDEGLQPIARRVSNSIVLLQCVATSPDFKKDLVNARIPEYLYPFMKIRNSTPSIEHIRLASLGTIGALVKNVDDPSSKTKNMGNDNVIHYLIGTEIFPCCLCSLEFGNELSKFVSAYIIRKLLESELGFRYCCDQVERFLSVIQIFRKSVEQIVELNLHTIKMLKSVLPCYLRFAEYPRVCQYMNKLFPPKFCSSLFLSQLYHVDRQLYEDVTKLGNMIKAGLNRLNLPPLGKW